MLLSVFLPLILLGLTTNDVAGSLLAAPATCLVVWLFASLVAVTFKLPEVLERLALSDRYAELIDLQNRFSWILAGWLLLMQALCHPAWLISPTLTALFPRTWTVAFSVGGYVLLLAWSAPAFHRAIIRVFPTDQTSWEYFRARLSIPMLLFPPLLLGSLMEDTLSFLPVVPFLSDLPVLLAAPVFCLLLYLFAPNLFNLAWQAGPLDDDPHLVGEIRRIAEATGTPIAGVRVWNTFKEPIPNAAVVGLLPGHRFVYLTRYLLQIFPTRERLVVVAHEIGHFRLGHVWTYLAFTLLLVTATLAVRVIIFLFWPRLPDLFGSWTLGLEFVGFLLVFLLVFTALSRRGEIEADRFATLAVGRGELASAMERLQDHLRPSSGRWPRWMETHPDFGERINDILTWEGTMEDLLAHARRVRLAMLGVMLVLGLLVVPTLRPVGGVILAAFQLERATDAAFADRMAGLRALLKDHPALDELEARRAFLRGNWGEGLRRALVLSGFDRPVRRSEVFQHSAPPEIALHLEIVQFLLQALDLRGIHGIPLFDHLFDPAEILLHH